jgi:hypothetical protein
MQWTDWAEYDSAAGWLARRGLTGNDGDPLPPNISSAVFHEITEHPEAFARHVQDTAYAEARSATIRRIRTA